MRKRWKQTYQNSVGWTFRHRRPRKFDDVDKVMGMIVDLHQEFELTAVVVGGKAHSPASLPRIRKDFEAMARGQKLRTLEIIGSGPSGFVWIARVGFEPDDRFDHPVVFRVAPEIMVGEALHERFLASTTEIPRWHSRREVVLDPVTADAAVQHRVERQAALYGALAGAAVGAGVSVVVAVIAAFTS